MKIFKILALALAVTLVSAAVAGSIYQALALKRDLERFPPPGELFEVDGHKMHIHCQGTGSPTVLVEPGIWGNAWQWQHINKEVSNVTRICGYDRPGFGYSELAAVDSVSGLADKLHALLDKAGITDELILVGHSAGGLYVREYFHRYPDKVAGMVLVESSSEKQEPGGIDTLYVAAKYLAPLGLVRVLGMSEDEVSRSAMPAELKPRQVVLYTQSHTPSAMVQESELFDDYVKSKPGPSSLGALPLTVISRGRPLEDYVGISPEYKESFKEYLDWWRDLQIELASLSTDSKHVFAENSDHNIQYSEPEIVVDEINDLVVRLRND